MCLLSFQISGYRFITIFIFLDKEVEIFKILNNIVNFVPLASCTIKAQTLVKSYAISILLETGE